MLGYSWSPLENTFTKFTKNSGFINKINNKNNKNKVNLHFAFGICQISGAANENFGLLKNTPPRRMPESSPASMQAASTAYYTTACVAVEYVAQWTG